MRIIRTCRALGIAPIAVYAPSDAGAPHVLLADQAFPLPADAPAESYLHIPRLLEVARIAHADAVHPGYGFLAENPAFAAACAEAGLRFVGPPADVLARCGDKARTRELVAAAGVPVLPGTGPVGDAEAAAAAARIGFPLLIKAAGGGGGKGIHLVQAAGELPGALRLARGEALAAFGDDRVYLERWLPRPRHVEVQILADHDRHVVHLGERDCSIQRRHQKVIEESPSPSITPALRERLAAMALAAARAIGYVNAGTIEFLLDGEDAYFIEINARLQVEHPVTEMRTGLDLVAVQLAIAGDRGLPVTQSEVVWRGHAIECRVGAEDPHHGFLPSSGVIEGMLEPGGPGVRVDSGLIPGLPVSRHFDPLLAKVIAWAPTRQEAIARMAAALDEAAVAGVRTTLPFLRWAMGEPAFQAGAYDTGFAEGWRRRVETGASDEAVTAAAITAAVWTHRRRSRLRLPAVGESRWARAPREEAVEQAVEPWGRDVAGSRRTDAAWPRAHDPVDARKHP